MFKLLKTTSIPILFLALLFTSCEEVITPDLTDNSDNPEYALPGVATKPANKFTTLFNRFGNGWTGGDATY